MESDGGEVDIVFLASPGDADSCSGCGSLGEGGSEVGLAVGDDPSGLGVWEVGSGVSESGAERLRCTSDLNARSNMTGSFRFLFSDRLMIPAAAFGLK